MKGVLWCQRSIPLWVVMVGALFGSGGSQAQSEGPNSGMPSLEELERQLVSQKQKDVGEKGIRTPTDATPKGKDQNLVAIVNGIPIRRDFYGFYAKTQIAKAKSTKAYTDLTEPERVEMLNNLIRIELVAMEAKKLGIDKLQQTVASLNRARLDTIEKEKDGTQKASESPFALTLLQLEILLNADATQYLSTRQPSNTELESAYNTRVDKIRTQYHARHILVNNQEAAQSIINALTSGAKFEELAKRESLDSSKTNGGDLGWFNLSMMVRPFAVAVSSLKVGETTMTPVHSQFGWHVIKLEGKRDIAAPTFDEMKDQLAQEMRVSAFRSHMDDLLKSANVERFL